MKEQKPRKTMEYIIDLNPHIGFLVLFDSISPTIPSAGKIKT